MRSPFTSTASGSSALDLVDRAAFITSGYGVAPGSAREDRPELLGRAEPAALDLAEVHVVHGRERREQRARRAAPASSTSAGQQRSIGVGARRPRPRYRVAGSSPVTRAEWYGPRRDDLAVADRGLDLALVVGAERHHDLVGPDGEQLRVVDHGQVRDRRPMRLESRHEPRCISARCAERRDASTHALDRRRAGACGRRRGRVAPLLQRHA